MANTVAAPTPFDGLKPFSFNNVKFPYKTYSVQGGIRRHTFEYPHAPGGATEKMGRKLYEIHVTSNFTAGLLKLYPVLWDDLKKLRRLWENQSTNILNIPHIGELPAFVDSWKESVTGKDRSTIEVEITFIEDSNERFAFISTATTTAAAMSDQLIAFQNQAFAVNASLSDNTQNIFSTINSVCSSVLGVKDQIDLYGSLVVSKVDSLTAIIQDADQQVKELNNPDFWPLLNSLHDLWASSVQLQQDIGQGNVNLRVYTTPVRMTVAQVSSAIFGDNSRAIDIMTLNPIDDPLSIPAGSQLQYYL